MPTVVPHGDKSSAINHLLDPVQVAHDVKISGALLWPPPLHEDALEAKLDRDPHVPWSSTKSIPQLECRTLDERSGTARDRFSANLHARLSTEPAAAGS